MRTLLILTTMLFGHSALALNDCAPKYLGKWKCDIGGFWGTILISQTGPKTLTIRHEESGREHEYSKYAESPAIMDDSDNRSIISNQKVVNADRVMEEDTFFCDEDTLNATRTFFKVTEQAPMYTKMAVETEEFHQLNETRMYFRFPNNMGNWPCDKIQ